MVLLVNTVALAIEQMLAASARGGEFRSIFFTSAFLDLCLGGLLVAGQENVVTWVRLRTWGSLAILPFVQCVEGAAPGRPAGLKAGMLTT